MLYWAAVFFIIAIVSGMFGFGEVTAVSSSIAQILFYLFLVGFIITMVLHFTRRIDKKSGI